MKKFKVNFQKLLSVFTALVLSVTLLSLNCFAFNFNGSSRTIQEAYKDWFQSLHDYASGDISSEQFNNACDRFAVDLAYTGIFLPDELLAKFANATVSFLTGGTNNSEFDSLFFDTMEKIGLPNFKKEFEEWYEQTYGKKYGKDENAFSSKYDVSGYSYYIFFDDPQGNHYKLFINYSGLPITVEKKTNASGSITCQYFQCSAVFPCGATRYINDSYDSKWESDYAQSGVFVLSGNYSYSPKWINVQTNLPLNYWGDMVGGDPIIDWDSEFGDGDSTPPSLTPEEFYKFLEDFLLALENSQPDLSTIEGILRAIYNKCCEISNKIQSASVVQKVSVTVNNVLDKLTEFFNSFIDIFGDFFGKLGEFFQSVFVPSDGYISSSLMDIKAEFDEAFSFAGDLRSIIDTCITSYKNGGKNPPDISIKVDGYGFEQKLDFSVFNGCIDLLRSVFCAFIYCTFAWNTYKRIPLYISGGGEQ